MQIRRVVTGLGAAGRAGVASDGPAPRSHDLVHVPGMSTTMLWATSPGEPLQTDGADPTPGIRRQLPEPGGTCFLIVRFPPDSVFADPSFDPVAADAEQRIASPGIADAFEPDNPGMHTTDSVDYVLVLDGEVWLELDDGALTRLRCLVYEHRENLREALREAAHTASPLFGGGKRTRLFLRSPR